ncbi:sigma-54-dependent Fis family transcriptional regulator [Paenibacillus sp. R14(2021)]|uniref:sigma-54 interaction domain-containing protein n=1 Tax=Paenibacillus sp. R14(2021) TaxID=2859228 RepID=UPI001C611BC8|nr:sigma 54-interacting transcriptional regulator [Paenibacillus sp. R14(2021)]
MFKLEQLPLNTCFTLLQPDATIQQLVDVLEQGQAAMITTGQPGNQAILVLPGEAAFIRSCFAAHKAASAATQLGDSPFVSFILKQEAELLEDMMFSRLLSTNRPLIFADEDGLMIGFIQLSELLLHAETERQRWQTYFATLSETVTDAVTVVDRDGEVICWNPIAEEIYDLPKRDILGRRIGEHFETETLMVLKILDEGRMIRNTYHRPREDTHVLINASPIRDVHGAIIGGIAAEQDITQLVRLNEQLTSAHTFSHQTKTENKELFSLIKGKGPAIAKVIQWARKVAVTDTPVLLVGEGGSGKEQLAQIIHHASSRSDEVFLSVNCGIVPMGLLEAELFGFQGGTFSGSHGGEAGKLEQAKDGTLFLNEIDRLSLELQAKLYHYLMQQTITRTGGSRPIAVQTRIIAASTENLAAKVEEGSFRADLYYALNVVSIALPPLRDRSEDIPAMIQMYLKQFSLQYQKPLPSLAPEVMLAFTNYGWPGNLLELRNTVERCVILCDDDLITMEQLPPVLQEQQQSLAPYGRDAEGNPAASATADKPLKASVNESEEQALIHEALSKTAGNKSAAAKLLGVSRGTLYNKMKEYGLA